jgi:hypothetical protein
VVIVALSAALASTAVAQVPTGDSVTGSGGGDTGSIFRFSFTIDAHSGPSGENPTGTASFSPILFGTFQGQITCLAVDGNGATLNFPVLDPASGPHVFTFTVTDSPAGDQIAHQVDVRGATDCTPLGSGGEPLVFGDIVVVDAQPLPTSKDQCKNGGWQSFGVFKNQGDCVSFVATGGKNPPGGH